MAFIALQAAAQNLATDFDAVIRNSNFNNAIVVGLVYSKAQMEDLTKNGVDRLIRYRNAIRKTGAQVIEISQYDLPDTLAKKMARIDGLMLPGGIDVDSRFYTTAERFVDKFQASDINFDVFEFSLIKHAKQQKIPLFGICRGSQLINVAMGGTLFQDLETYNRFLTQQHLKRSSAGVAAAEEHLLVLDRSSRIAKVLNVSEIRGNSWHHQAVEKIGRGLRVVALSPDKVIEAFESIGNWYVVGIQSHPEIALADDGKSKFFLLFKDFAEEAKRFHATFNSAMRLAPANVRAVSANLCTEESALRLKLR